MDWWGRWIREQMQKADREGKTDRRRDVEEKIRMSERGRMKERQRDMKGKRDWGDYRGRKTDVRRGEVKWGRDRDRGTEVDKAKARQARKKDMERNETKTREGQWQTDRRRWRMTHAKERRFAISPRLHLLLLFLPSYTPSSPPSLPPFCRLSDAAPTPRGFSLTFTIRRTNTPVLLQRNHPPRKGGKKSNPK